MYWFTGDEHLGHANILKYCNRPFSNTTEMDNEIIRRHNEVVGANDTVIHAGDFSLKHDVSNYLQCLAGKNVFLKGSHDYWGKDLNLSYLFEKHIEGIYVVVCHYCMRTWPRSFHGSIQLFGHSHGKLQDLENQYDVGVDNNDFYPVSLKTILQKIDYADDKQRFR